MSHIYSLHEKDSKHYTRYQKFDYHTLTIKVNSFSKDISIRDLTDTLGAVKVLPKHRRWVEWWGVPFET